MDFFFDTIGSHFVQVFYNELFVYSMRLVDNHQFRDLTSSYAETIKSYAAELRYGGELYKKFVQNLLSYYQKYTQTACMLDKFQDMLLSRVVPNEYYRDFTSTEKDALMQKILADVATRLVEILLSPELYKKIIDNHDNPATIKLLQDRVYKLFVSTRTSSFDRFIAARKSEAAAPAPVVAGSPTELNKKLYELLREYSTRLKTNELKWQNIIQGMLKKQNKMLAEYEEQAAQLQKLKRELESESEEKQRFLKGARNAHDEMLSREEELQKALVNLKSEYSNVVAERDRLSAELEQRKSALNSAGDLEALQDELVDLKEQLDELVQENIMLKRQLKLSSPTPSPDSSGPPDPLDAFDQPFSAPDFGAPDFGAPDFGAENGDENGAENGAMDNEDLVSFLAGGASK